MTSDSITTLPLGGDHQQAFNNELTIVFGILATLFAVVGLAFGAYQYSHPSKVPLVGNDVEMQMQVSAEGASTFASIENPSINSNATRTETLDLTVESTTTRPSFPLPRPMLHTKSGSTH